MLAALSQTQVSTEPHKTLNLESGRRALLQGGIRGFSGGLSWKKEPMKQLGRHLMARPKKNVLNLAEGTLNKTNHLIFLVH